MNSLDGIRVLDLSRVLAGPWCTQTLADLGADVIKIERPGTGDDTRTWGPPFLKDAQGQDTAEAAYYLGANRNKRSVTCDIAQPEGQALIRELVKHCQVFVENFKVGDMARYGLDYASLSAINPQLVYCSVTGFGQTGPYRERAGYDYAVQGIGGLMSVTGEKDGTPGSQPQKVGVAVAGAGAAGASPGSTINVCNRASARLPDGWPLRFLISAFDSTRMRRVASSCMPGAHNCVASSGSDGSEQRGSASQARPAFAHISSLRR